MKFSIRIFVVSATILILEASANAPFPRVPKPRSVYSSKWNRHQSKISNHAQPGLSQQSPQEWGLSSLRGFRTNLNPGLGSNIYRLKPSDHSTVTSSSTANFESSTPSDSLSSLQTKLGNILNKVNNDVSKSKFKIIHVPLSSDPHRDQTIKLPFPSRIPGESSNFKVVHISPSSFGSSGITGISSDILKSIAKVEADLSKIQALSGAYSETDNIASNQPTSQWSNNNVIAKAVASYSSDVQNQGDINGLSSSNNNPRIAAPTTQSAPKATAAVTNIVNHGEASSNGSDFFLTKHYPQVNYGVPKQQHTIYGTNPATTSAKSYSGIRGAGFNSGNLDNTGNYPQNFKNQYVAIASSYGGSKAIASTVSSSDSIGGPSQNLPMGSSNYGLAPNQQWNKNGATQQIRSPLRIDPGSKDADMMSNRELSNTENDDKLKNFVINSPIRYPYGYRPHHIFSSPTFEDIHGVHRTGNHGNTQPVSANKQNNNYPIHKSRHPDLFSNVQNPYFHSKPSPQLSTHEASSVVKSNYPEDNQSQPTDSPSVTSHNQNKTPDNALESEKNELDSTTLNSSYDIGSKGPTDNSSTSGSSWAPKYDSTQSTFSSTGYSDGSPSNETSGSLEPKSDSDTSSVLLSDGTESLDSSPGSSKAWVFDDGFVKPIDAELKSDGSYSEEYSDEDEIGGPEFPPYFNGLAKPGRQHSTWLDPSSPKDSDAPVTNKPTPNSSASQDIQGAMPKFNPKSPENTQQDRFDSKSSYSPSDIDSSKTAKNSPGSDSSWTLEGDSTQSTSLNVSNGSHIDESIGSSRPKSDSDISLVPISHGTELPASSPDSSKSWIFYDSKNPIDIELKLDDMHTNNNPNEDESVGLKSGPYSNGLATPQQIISNYLHGHYPEGQYSTLLHSSSPKDANAPVANKPSLNIPTGQGIYGVPPKFNPASSGNTQIIKPNEPGYYRHLINGRRNPSYLHNTIHPYFLNKPAYQFATHGASPIATFKHLKDNQHQSTNSPKEQYEALNNPLGPEKDGFDFKFSISPVKVGSSGSADNSADSGSSWTFEGDNIQLRSIFVPKVSHIDKPIGSLKPKSGSDISLVPVSDGTEIPASSPDSSKFWISYDSKNPIDTELKADDTHTNIYPNEDESVSPEPRPFSDGLAIPHQINSQYLYGHYPDRQYSTRLHPTFPKDSNAPVANKPTPNVPTSQGIYGAPPKFNPMPPGSSQSIKPNEPGYYKHLIPGKRYPKHFYTTQQPYFPNKPVHQLPTYGASLAVESYHTESKLPQSTDSLGASTQGLYKATYNLLGAEKDNFYPKFSKSTPYIPAFGSGWASKDDGSHKNEFSGLSTPKSDSDRSLVTTADRTESSVLSPQSSKKWISNGGSKNPIDIKPKPNDLHDKDNLNDEESWGPESQLYANRLAKSQQINSHYPYSHYLQIQYPKKLRPSSPSDSNAPVANEPIPNMPTSQDINGALQKFNPKFSGNIQSISSNGRSYEQSIHKKHYSSRSGVYIDDTTQPSSRFDDIYDSISSSQQKNDHNTGNSQDDSNTISTDNKLDAINTSTDQALTRDNSKDNIPDNFLLKNYRNKNYLTRGHTFNNHVQYPKNIHTGISASDRTLTGASTNTKKGSYGDDTASSLSDDSATKNDDDSDEDSSEYEGSTDSTYKRQRSKKKALKFSSLFNTWLDDYKKPKSTSALTQTTGVSGAKYENGNYANEEEEVSSHSEDSDRHIKFSSASKKSTLQQNSNENEEKNFADDVPSEKLHEDRGSTEHKSRTSSTKSSSNYGASKYSYGIERDALNSGTLGMLMNFFSSLKKKFLGSQDKNIPLE